MFGNFMENFGLNGFPWQGLDAQGGLFGSNAPQAPLIGSQSSGTAPVSFAPQPAGGPGGVSAAPAGSPAAPQGSPPMAGATSPLSLAGQSPLAAPAAPGGPAPAIPGQNPPAAGVKSEFGTGTA